MVGVVIKFRGWVKDLRFEGFAGQSSLSFSTAKTAAAKAAGDRQFKCPVL